MLQYIFWCMWCGRNYRIQNNDIGMHICLKVSIYPVNTSCSEHTLFVVFFPFAPLFLSRSSSPNREIPIKWRVNQVKLYVRWVFFNLHIGVWMQFIRSNPTSTSKRKQNTHRAISSIRLSLFHAAVYCAKSAFMILRIPPDHVFRPIQLMPCCISEKVKIFTSGNDYTHIGGEQHFSLYSSCFHFLLFIQYSPICC